MLLSMLLLEAMMAGIERGERLQIMLNAEELTAVENWRFERRMPSRAAAVRELLRRGLQAVGFLTAEQGTKSQDFGVLSEGNGSTVQGDNT
jgi:hypothetical protein